MSEYMPDINAIRSSHKIRKSFAVACALLAVVVILGVFWGLKLTGITMIGKAYCGFDEHTHSEECYVLAEECSHSADAGDEHVADCYVKELICGLTEHTHDSLCYPDPEADIESADMWEADLEKAELTDSLPENLVNIALTQLGYTESERNYEFDEELSEKMGYTRYGQWYGKPYSEWESLFIAFCLEYAGADNVEDYTFDDVTKLCEAFAKKEIYGKKDGTIARGDIVFFDDDADVKVDGTGIVTFFSENTIIVIRGNYENKVEKITLSDADTILGYAQTDRISMKKSEEATEPSAPETDKVPVLMSSPLALGQQVQTMASGDDSVPPAQIEFYSELSGFISSVEIRDKDGNVIPPNGTVYIGETYNVFIGFDEVYNHLTSDYRQFEYNEDGVLYYQIPANFHCFDSGKWEPINTNRNGITETVGEYYVHENGLLEVRFFDFDGENFFDKYTNTHFNIQFETTIAEDLSGTNQEINFGNEINVNINVDGGAAMNVTKTHGHFDQITSEMEYTIRVEATHGVVKDLVIDDQIWDTHETLRDTILVTDLDGNPIDPQPTISNHPKHNQGANEGFSLSGFPDFPAGEGFLIKYRTKVYDEIIENNDGSSIGLWNGLDVNGKNSDGDNVYVWAEDWESVKLHNLKKEGSMKTIKDKNGNDVPVLEWVVREGTGNTLIDSAIIIDTLGEGLSYYTGEPIYVRTKNADGSYTVHYIPWEDVTRTDTSITFDLPPGYEYKIIYYTTYTPLGEGEYAKEFHNTVKSIIHGNESETGGQGIVVSFTPEVHKTARGTDGAYVYYTITTEVPSHLSGGGNFFFTDLLAFWNYPYTGTHTYVENLPEDMVVTATKADGTVITFTPYVEGGPTENTYTLIAPLPEGDYELYHTFDVLFNTDGTSHEDSKWMLDENSTLTVSYKIPFDAATGTDWYFTNERGKTLGAILRESEKVANEVYFTYAPQVEAVGSVSYEYSPTITKDAVVNDDGTIDYTVVFNNTVPGSGGDEGYLNNYINEAVFFDRFDERLEYVPGSLMVTTWDPWRNWLWLCKYRYDGTVDGNEINVSFNDFKFEEYNYDEAQYDTDGSELWGTWLTGCKTLRDYFRSMNSGGRYVVTYQLRVKDDYLYTTDTAQYKFYNTAQITWDDSGSSGQVTESVEFETGLLKKHAVQDGNQIDFEILINEFGLDILEGVDSLTIVDTMTKNLSIYWETIKLYYYDNNINDWVNFDDSDKYTYSVTYDQESNALTMVVPDSLKIKMDYTTLVLETGNVSVENSVKIEGKANVSDIVNSLFHVSDHMGDASGSVHNITLLKQDSVTGALLKDAQFALYGPVGDPDAIIPVGVNSSITASNGTRLYYIGTYTTDENGIYEIETQYLSVGGPYALVETKAPAGYQIMAQPAHFFFYSEDPTGTYNTVTTLIAVPNTNFSYVLPATGGFGTMPFILSGYALMTVAVTVLIIRRKRSRT
ncbi:MAG: LPXTG cell wall anchor domain-containing protein [Ruminococcaceae bacterium]|nr:LPXTG cell wall anchor domain-containing protein [Oscillospiraceae bacterium]